MIVDVMGNLHDLKCLIVDKFKAYVNKITRGYTFESLDYQCIKDAMMCVDFIENYTPSPFIASQLIDIHIVNLNKI